MIAKVSIDTTGLPWCWLIGSCWAKQLFSRARICHVASCISGNTICRVYWTRIRIVSSCKACCLHWGCLWINVMSGICYITTSRTLGTLPGSHRAWQLLISGWIRYVVSGWCCVAGNLSLSRGITTWVAFILSHRAFKSNIMSCICKNTIGCFIRLIERVVWTCRARGLGGCSKCINVVTRLRLETLCLTR